MNGLPFAEELFHQFRPLWQRIAYQYLRRPQDRQDAIQEACRKFLAIEREWATLEDAKRYFSTVLVHTCVDFYKVSKRRREAQLEEEDGYAGVREDAWTRNTDSVRWEQEEAILQNSAAAIANLPPDQRLVIEKLLLDENPVTLTELSRELNVPISTLKSRLTTGIDKVKNILRKKGLL